MVRPQKLLMENVAALLHRGMGEVCGELAESGYDAEWDCIPACAVGAPHQRDRVFIVAAAGRKGIHKRRLADETSKSGGLKNRIRRNGLPQEQDMQREVLADSQRKPPGLEGGRDSDTGGQGRESARTPTPEILRPRNGEIGSKGLGASGSNVADTSEPNGKPDSTKRQGQVSLRNRSWWSTEPNVGRVANGVPSRVDRLRCCGNAVVPQVAEYIGKLLKETK